MAKHNCVHLYGRVIKDPQILKNDNNEFIKGVCPITVIRGQRETGNKLNHVRFDAPVIMSGDPERVKEMSSWKTGDMVEIKGSITTKEIRKRSFCKHCGGENIVEGNIVYINPIYLDKRETNLSEKDGVELLKRRCEISNEVSLVGKLCREPDFYKQDDLVTTQYQIAVNRKFYLKDDIAENRTDYPWIKSFGKIAESDRKALRKGSVVLIDGMIQTRETKRTTKCIHCEKNYTWGDSALEVIPYSVEYLQEFTTEEERAEKNQKIIENAESNIFG